MNVDLADSNCRIDRLCGKLCGKLCSVLERVDMDGQCTVAAARLSLGTEE